MEKVPEISGPRAPGVENVLDVALPVRYISPFDPSAIAVGDAPPSRLDQTRLFGRIKLSGEAAAGLTKWGQ